jgi:hypothetical protein
VLQGDLLGADVGGPFAALAAYDWLCKLRGISYLSGAGGANAAFFAGGFGVLLFLMVGCR